MVLSNLFKRKYPLFICLFNPTAFKFDQIDHLMNVLDKLVIVYLACEKVDTLEFMDTGMKVYRNKKK